MVGDLVCFSHLRWHFVYQRPQHLMSRFAKQYRVFFIEEPLYHKGEDAISIRQTEEQVMVVTPMLQEGDMPDATISERQKKLVNILVRQHRIKSFMAWYYTPMALKISSHLKPAMVVYDCMDELSAFKFAPAELKIMEAELFSRAHVVFTGGQTLYEHKKFMHHNIHPFPSSIDKDHFYQARLSMTDPEDQQGIPGPRFGFHGVIDERFDVRLIDEVAAKAPDWNFIFVGPVVKIDPVELPARPNIHYLGGKDYKELPQYLSGWDFTMIPFAKNESTKNISPTKTPEYLAAGKPVISSSITDVVHPYGSRGLVYIADTADEFIAAAKLEMSKTEAEVKEWLNRVDEFLAPVSWEATCTKMLDRINDVKEGLEKGSSNLKSVA